MSAFNNLVDELTFSSIGIPCVSVLVQTKNGETIFSKMAGRQGLSRVSAAISASSIFRLSSSTKLFTSIAALQCVERGQIGLDEPVAHVLPELADKQLLTHTSGIGYDLLDSRLRTWRKSRGEACKAMSGIATGMFDAPLLFEPGLGWAYGAGHDVAGMLVSRLNRVGLEEYMQKHIFEVLGMESCTFFIRKMEGGMERLVECVTRRKGEEELVVFPDATEDNAKEEQGSGGLYSSVGDYVAVLKDLLQDEPKLLQRHSVDLLFQPQLDVGSPAMEGFMQARLMWGSFSGGVPGHVKVNYGLAGLLLVEGDETDGSVNTTLQWAGGTGTLWMLLKEKGIAAFYATQIFPPMDPKATQLREAFMKEVRALPRQVVADSA